MENIQMLQRLLLLINKVKPASDFSTPKFVATEELLQYVKSNMNIRYGNTFGYSIRTMQRDFQKIDELFGIIIKYQHGSGYFFADKECVSIDRYEELLLNFDLLTALNAESGLQNFVLAEHHRPLGSDNLPILMNAIKQQHYLTFDYTLVRHNDKLVHKKVAPYFLKESNQRWYLLAMDMDDDKLKSFGTDRISNISIDETCTFEREASINPDELFKYSFGIWDDENIPIEDIILSYSHLDGVFLKTVPLHHSQTILIDNDEEFRIQLRLRVTNDFVMELLSRSGSLTVIEPRSLRERIVKIYQRALNRNTS